MIHWLIAIAGIVLLMMTCRAWWATRRARKQRENMRHVVGAYQWWGRK